MMLSRSWKKMTSVTEVVIHTKKEITTLERGRTTKSIFLVKISMSGIEQTRFAGPVLYAHPKKFL
jgi:hypothetical protein